MYNTNVFVQLSIIYCMVHMYIFLFLFYEYRCSKRTFRISAAILFVAVSAVCLWIYFTRGIAAMGQWGVLVASIPTLIFFFVMSRQRNAQFIFIFCFSDTVCIWIELGSALVDYAVGGGGIVTLVLRLVSFPLLEYAAWRWVRRPFLEMSRAVRKGWAMFAAMTGICYLILVMISVYPTAIFDRPEDIPLAVMVLILIALSYGTIFWVQFEQFKILEVQERQRILEAQTAVMSRRMEDIRRTEDAMRIERHDMRHHFQTIAAFAQNGDAGAVLDYVGKSRERLDSITPKRYCDHPILNAVLTNAAAQAEQMGIVMELAVLLPEELPADALDLSIVFANALENAIQAVKTLPEDKRRIVCKSVTHPKLIIEISNPYQGTVAFDKQGFPIADKRGHGIGTRSILAFAEKYNALCCFRAENGLFKFQMAV